MKTLENIQDLKKLLLNPYTIRTKQRSPNQNQRDNIQ